MGLEHDIDHPTTPPPEGPSSPAYGGPNPNAVTPGFRALLNALYQKYYRRNATDEEAVAHSGNPGGIDAVEALIKADNPNGPAAGTAKDFIRQWQQTHPASEGIGPLADALKANGFNVARFMYGSTPSNNEFVIDGAKFKVLSGEDNLARATWYVPGTNDGPSPGSFGAEPEPYHSTPWTGGDYTPPPLPTELQTPFQAPTQAELEGSAGYLARLEAGRRARQRAAAADGTVLGGGYAKAITRYGQEYASNEYANYYGQRLNTRQQNYGEYTGNVNVGNQTYQNRYGAWQNENARTLGDYLTRVTTRRNWENDYWGRYRDVSTAGREAAR